MVECVVARMYRLSVCLCELQSLASGQPSVLPYVDGVFVRMDAIRKAVSDVLPSLSTDLLDSLIENLMKPDVGVTTVEDLKFVVESDLRGHVNAIMARKLLASWKQSGMNYFGQSILS